MPMKLNRACQNSELNLRFLDSAASLSIERLSWISYEVPDNAILKTTEYNRHTGMTRLQALCYHSCIVVALTKDGVHTNDDCCTTRSHPGFGARTLASVDIKTWEL